MKMPILDVIEKKYVCQIHAKTMVFVRISGMNSSALVIDLFLGKIVIINIQLVLLDMKKPLILWLWWIFKNLIPLHLEWTFPCSSGLVRKTDSFSTLALILWNNNSQDHISLVI